MKVVIDTHSLFWFLIPNKKLKTENRQMLRDSVNIFIPTIVILELFYMMRKLKSSNKYIIVVLDLEITEAVTESGGLLEMHDNIIMNTAKSLNLPLVTIDPEIQAVYKNTIW